MTDKQKEILKRSKKLRIVAHIKCAYDYLVLHGIQKSHTHTQTPPVLINCEKKKKLRITHVKNGGKLYSHGQLKSPIFHSKFIISFGHLNSINIFTYK